MRLQSLASIPNSDLCAYLAPCHVRIFRHVGPNDSFHNRHRLFLCLAECETAAATYVERWVIRLCAQPNCSSPAHERRGTTIYEHDCGVSAQVDSQDIFHRVQCWPMLCMMLCHLWPSRPEHTLYAMLSQFAITGSCCMVPCKVLLQLRSAVCPPELSTPVEPWAECHSFCCRMSVLSGTLAETACLHGIRADAMWLLDVVHGLLGGTLWSAVGWQFVGPVGIAPFIQMALKPAWHAY